MSALHERTAFPAGQWGPGARVREVIPLWLADLDAGRLVTVAGPGGTRRYDWNTAGLVERVTDADGVVTAASIRGPHVSLSAPGSDILTASAAGADCRFATDPSPAFAAAYVAAAAALVAAAHPGESPAQWAYRLEATAVRADLATAGIRADRVHTETFTI